MSANQGTSERPRLCRPRIVAAGLPHRDEVILEREKNLYAPMVDRLMGRRSEWSFEDAAESLTMEMLEDAFAGRDGFALPAAAWLAGRCQPDRPEDQEKLTKLLHDLLDSLSVDRLGIMDRAYIEAAMSLALRGEPDTARKALSPLVGEHASSTSDSYLAAFYLAQLGDPSGYPVMREALRSSNEHTRLMAVRHLIGFKPYDSRTVGGKTVDIRAELVQRLKDHDPYVRVEVPYYLAEAGVEDLKELLRPVAKDDRDSNVREAARDVLERLDEG
jgi:HEAT repeat protein